MYEIGDLLTTLGEKVVSFPWERQFKERATEPAVVSGRLSFARSGRDCSAYLHVFLLSA